MGHAWQSSPATDSQPSNHTPASWLNTMGEYWKGFPHGHESGEPAGGPPNLSLPTGTSKLLNSQRHSHAHCVQAIRTSHCSGAVYGQAFSQLRRLNSSFANNCLSHKFKRVRKQRWRNWHCPQSSPPASVPICPHTPSKRAHPQYNHSFSAECLNDTQGQCLNDTQGRAMTKKVVILSFGEK